MCSLCMPPCGWHLAEFSFDRHTQRLCQAVVPSFDLAAEWMPGVLHGALPIT